ncbi:MAG TPA: hypothetical protein V6D08_08105, partial [Candidatus Obscuribacterales bacterium]
MISAKYLVANAVSLSLVLSLSIGSATAVQAQAGGAPTVSMVTLQVVPGPQGQQVVTPRGMVVPLPGAGVNGNVVQVYMGSQGGYWYIDRYGQTVDLTGAVQQMRAMTGSYQQVPQYAPAPSQPAQSEQSSSSGGSGAGSAVATAAAAGLGAMAGSALTNSLYYNNVPYGTPMYYGAGGRPYYYGAGGNQVYVNRNTTVDNSVENSYATNLQKQQEWYAGHQQRNTEQFQQWQKVQDNPFVNAQHAQAATGAGGERRGRFGRGSRGGDGGESAAFPGGPGQGDGARLDNGPGASDGPGGRFGGRGRFGGDGGGALQGAGGGEARSLQGGGG